MDNLEFLVKNGISLDQVKSWLSGGLTMQEIVESVKRIQDRGETIVDESPENVKPDDFSDTGNASVFVSLYGNRVRFTDSRGWLIYDGTR